MRHIGPGFAACPYCWYLFFKYQLPPKVKRWLGRESPEEKLYRAIFGER